jgi:hypothetical protein
VRRRAGQRPGLSSSAAERIVRGWIDDAIELLFTMPFSCALDVVDRFPDGLDRPSVGFVLGTTRHNVLGIEQKHDVVDALEQLREFAAAEQAR